MNITDVLSLLLKSSNDYFSKNLVESWGKPNTHAGKPMVCSKTCGKEFDAFAEQFK